MYAALVTTMCLLGCAELPDAPTTKGAPVTEHAEVERLLAAAPRFKTADPATPEAFQFTCYTAHMGARMRITRIGNRGSMLVEASDGTPMIVAAGGRALVYDALHGELLYFPDALPVFVLGPRDENLHLRFEVTAFPIDAGTGADGDCRFELDLRSLLRTEGIRHTVAPQPGNRLLLVGLTKRGNSYASEIDPAAEAPFQTVRLFAGDASEGPALEVYDIRVGADVDERYLRFPPLERYAALPVREVKEEAAEIERSVEAIIQSFSFRNTLQVESAQRAAERKLGRKLDWAALREADRRLSEQLRSIERDGAATPIEHSR